MNSEKLLSPGKEAQFELKLSDIGKLIKRCKFRTAFHQINKELERAHLCGASIKVKLQLLRRGIISIIKILRSYKRRQSKNNNETVYAQKLFQYLYFYHDQISKELKYSNSGYIKYHVNQLILRTTQIKALFNYEYENPTQNIQFMATTYKYHHQQANTYFTLNHLDLSLQQYELCFQGAQEVINIILKKDPMLKKELPQFRLACRQIIITTYIMSFVYELQSNYRKVLESLKLAQWFSSEIFKNEHIQTHIFERYKKVYQSYYEYLYDQFDMNKLFSVVFPNAKIPKEESTVFDFKSRFKIEPIFIVRPDYEQYHSNQNSKRVTHHSHKPTDQETMSVSPRYEICKTFSFDCSPRLAGSSHFSRIEKKVIQEPKLTINYDEFEKRIEKPKAEQLKVSENAKDLDCYYQSRILESFSQASTFTSLQSMKEQVQGQMEVNRINQQDFVVGRKLLKFQKYQYQRIGTQANFMKVISDIESEQARIDAMQQVKMRMKPTQMIQKKIHEMQLMKQRSVHMEQSLVNCINISQDLRNIVSEYEQILGPSTTRINDKTEMTSSISRILRTSNDCIKSTIKTRRQHVEVKNRKSILSSLHEQLVK